MKNILAVVLRKLMSLYRAINPSQRRAQLKRHAIQTATYKAMWTRVAHQLHGSVTEVGEGYLVLEHNDSWTIVNNANVRIDDHVALTVAGNKPLVYDLLKRGNFDYMPKYLVFTMSDFQVASDFLTECESFVIKPAYGTGGGDGVTTLVHSKWELFRASLFAATHCPVLLMEEEVAGKSYRLLYLGGRLIDAIERQPPVVIGDGSMSIKQLIEVENHLRQESDGTIATSLISIDSALRNKLRGLNLTMSSVPDKGEKIVLKTVVNQNRRNENIRITSHVHETFETFGHEIVRYLDLNLVGVDIITRDISEPLSSQTPIVNDINTMPGLHHHYFVRSDGQDCPDVAEQVIRYISATKVSP